MFEQRRKKDSGSSWARIFLTLLLATGAGTFAPNSMTRTAAAKEHSVKEPEQWANVKAQKETKRDLEAKEKVLENLAQLRTPEALEDLLKIFLYEKEEDQLDQIQEILAPIIARYFGGEVFTSRFKDLFTQRRTKKEASRDKNNRSVVGLKDAHVWLAYQVMSTWASQGRYMDIAELLPEFLDRPYYTAAAT